MKGRIIADSFHLKSKSLKVRAIFFDNQ